MRSARVVVWVGLAFALTACGASGAGSGTTPSAARPQQPAAQPQVVDPPNFVLAREAGLSSTVELVSPVTGRVMKVLGTFGQSFTNNGLTLSPGARYAYVTLIGARSLLIERLAAASTDRSLVAEGEQPALSPNGDLLAYFTEAASSARLAVRDLSSSVLTS